MFKKELLKSLNTLPAYELGKVDFEQIVNGNYVKDLRSKLEMSQIVFSKMLGVSKKTVEKWEQGTNRIKGPSSRLLYLIEKDESLCELLLSLVPLNGNRTYYTEEVSHKKEFKMHYTKIPSNNLKDSDVFSNY